MANTTDTLASSDRVLSTLNADGSRRWLRPKLSQGRYLTARRWTAYLLIALFAMLPMPWFKIGGKPAVLLDVQHREFTFFGATFLPTDTVLFALFMLGVFFTIFLATAVLGRVWCGWACPHTVYLEFVYRPIERLFEGPPGVRGRPGRKKSDLRTVLKYVTYLFVSLIIAHIFVSYFVGVDQLVKWMQGSPFEHPTYFMIMAITTGLMMFHFSYFREQLCIVACPYGRFQSVLLDEHSLIVSYDPQRGEPRRKPAEARTLPEKEKGDCIDCGLCVDTCPTGIDIREGLKMECVHCTQCIDACDHVMDKVGKPRGLIRYSSQAAIDGESSRFLRPRVVVYPLILVVIGVLFAVALGYKTDADVNLFRGIGRPYQVFDDGRVSNQMRIKITNRAETEANYTIDLVSPDDHSKPITDIEVVTAENPVTVGPKQKREISTMIFAPLASFDKGERWIGVRVRDGDEYESVENFALQGPRYVGPAAKETSTDAKDSPAAMDDATPGESTAHGT